MDVQFPTTKDFWKLPTMAPSSDPVFISPPHPPRQFIDSANSSSKAQQPRYGTDTTPSRGRSGRKIEERSPTSNQPLRLQNVTPVMPPPNGHNFVVQLSHPATVSLPSSSTFQPYMAHQFAVQPPSMPRAARFPPPQYNPMQTGNGYGVGFSLPIRNRRMTSPGEAYRRRPRHMSLAALPSHPSPFASPSIPMNTSLQSGSILPTNAAGFQIRNPVDLLEVIRAHPEETFANIHAMGNENIRLKHDFLRLKQEVEQQRELQRNQAEELDSTIQHLFRVENSMKGILQLTIDRLEHEVCRLRGGGKVVQGVWLDDEEFSAVSQAVLDDKENWDDYIFHKVQMFKNASGRIWNTSHQGQSPNWKGKQKEETDKARDKKKPSWNPNAQAFIPSVTSSSSSDKSDITEIYSPIVPLPERDSPSPQPTIDCPASTSSPRVPLQSDVQTKSPQNHTRLLSPFPKLSPKPTPLSPAILYPGDVSDYPPLSALPNAIPPYQPKKRPPRGSPQNGSPSSTSYSPIRAPTYADSLRRYVPTPNERMPDAVLTMISDSLPQAYRRICPFSLTGLEPCPRATCPMKKLCPEYNDDRPLAEPGFQGGDLIDLTDSSPVKPHTPIKAAEPSQTSSTPTRDQLSQSAPETLTPRRENTQNWPTPRKNRSSMAFTPNKSHNAGTCSNARCGFIHEYATCIDDLNKENGGLTGGAAKGKGSYKDGGCKNEGRAHRRKMVHAPPKCPREEWKNREVVAGLRQAHREGRYF